MSEIFDHNKMDSPKILKLPLKISDKKTIFINLSGFFNLIHNSKQPLAKKIKYWIDNEVLPALIKYGSYSIQPKNINIPSFYDTETIASFYLKTVLYIGYVGFINGEHIFKYGLSRKMFQRDYKQHSNQFNQFKVVLIIETDNAELVEDLFESDVKSLNLHRVPALLK